MKLMNIVYGTGLYLATLFATYSTKAITYKDEDNVVRSAKRKRL